MPHAETWARARNVLCIRLDQAGDVLMTTPAIRALKQAVPGRRIALLTSPAAEDAARLVPEVDEVMTYASPWMKATPPRDSPALDLAFIETLRARHFDAAAIFSVFSQNPLPAAMLCYLAGIPLRAAHCHENPYQLLTDWLPDPEPTSFIRHEVERQLALAEHVGAPAIDTHLSLSVTPDACESAVAAAFAAGLDSRLPFFVVHPGASAPSRRYPPELLGEALRLTVQQTGLQALVLGGPGEEPLVQEVACRSGVPVTILAGGLSFGEMAALIQGAKLLIANNSSPMHVAAAVGTPVVALYALTNPQHTPWLVPAVVLSHDVPCRNCFKSICPEGHNDCLRRVTPQQVAEAACQLLGVARPVAIP